MLKDKRKNSRKPSGGSLAARIGKLESLLEEIAEALDPTEQKIIFVGPGQPGPNLDELPEKTVVIRFVGEAEINPEVAEKALQSTEEREAAKAEREPEQPAEVELAIDQPPEAAQPQGVHTHNGEEVTYEGYGVRWGKFPPIKERQRDHNPNRDWQKLNRSGIF